jgi:hypothetical protein
MECPACRQRFDPPAPDAGRATAVCPRCRRVVVLGDAPAAASFPESGTAPLLEPLPARESPTQIGVASQTLSLPPGKRVSVAILGGPRQGEAVTLVRPRLTFGRATVGEGADVQFADEELAPLHAALECHGARLVLRDLGSATGTFVGEERIGGAREVHDGDEFRLGRTAFLVVVSDS